MSGGQRVAVLFHRIGPYHLARLRAAGARCALTAVELFAVDDTYAWSRVDGAPNFTRLTLFDNQDLHRKRTSEVTRYVYHAARPESGQVASASARAQMAPRLRAPAP
jgi:hypothetical protein